MTTIQAFTIKPGEQADITFDMRDWVTGRVAEGQVAAEIVFEFRATPGLTYDATNLAIGHYTVKATSTQIGRVFKLALSATAADGDANVDARIVRVRAPTGFDLLPEDEGVLVDPQGNSIADPQGNLIVSP